LDFLNFELFVFYPRDGAGWAPKRRVARRFTWDPYSWQTTRHLNHPFCGVQRTAPARVTGDRAGVNGGGALQGRATLNHDLVGQTLEFEEVEGADIDAVSTGCAELDVDDWKLLVVHVDRIECTDAVAVSEAQTAPGTGASAATDCEGRTAGAES